MRAFLNGFWFSGVPAMRPIACDIVMFIFRVHSVSLTTQGQVTPVRFNRKKKSNEQGVPYNPYQPPVSAESRVVSWLHPRFIAGRRW